MAPTIPVSGRFAKRLSYVLKNCRDFPLIAASFALLPGFWPIDGFAGPGTSSDIHKPTIVVLDPPEKDFFSKLVDFHGIPIKAHAVVADEAMYAAYSRLSRQLEHLPMVISNLAAAGAELHIIGRDQVTTDLPEWRQDKGKPIYEPSYNGLTRDQRTRGMGGRLTSCDNESTFRNSRTKIDDHETRD
jgi:hypothetical protein